MSSNDLKEDDDQFGNEERSRSRSPSLSSIYSELKRIPSGNFDLKSAPKISRDVGSLFSKAITNEIVRLQRRAKGIKDMEFVKEFVQETETLRQRFLMFMGEENEEYKHPFEWEESAKDDAQTVDHLLEENVLFKPKTPYTATTLPWRRSKSVGENIRFFAFTDPTLKLKQQKDAERVFQPKERVIVQGQGLPLHGNAGIINYEEGPFAYVQFNLEGQEMQVQLPKTCIRSEKVAQKLSRRRKIAFLMGVIDCFFTTFFFFSQPQYYIHYHTLMFLICFFHRCFDFYYRHWHWCLIEVCYFINFFLLYVCWFEPTNVEFLKVCFYLSEGPILWGGIIFQNGLVFHSITKLASIRLHYSPCLLMFLVRNGFCGSSLSLQGVDLSLVDYFGAVKFFLLHQAFWCIVLGYFFKRQFWDDPKSSNCLSCLVESRSGLFYEAVNILGVDFWECVFASLYSFGASLAMIIAVPMYYSMYLHSAILFTLYVMYLWNGADFYDFVEEDMFD